MIEIKYRNVLQYKNGGKFKLEYTSIDKIEGEDSWQGSTPWDLIDRNLFTGLQDKNGKDIYEGDIMFNQNDNHNYQMLWSKSNACFMLGENGGQLSKYVLGEFWEVIGNIYENPELLK